MIVARFSESDDGDSQEVAERLRILLSEWLTVPIPFNSELLESVSALGDAKAVETRWGREIRAAYDLACAAASAIQHMENPVRIELRDTIQLLRILGRSWRIYCHRRARVHFESIFAAEPLAADAFLHSVRDYREAEPFDVLIKVGPLRSRGWGSAPDALLSAPRFATLIQIVWTGCADEDDFGYDPVAAPSGGFAVPSSAPVADGEGVQRAILT